MPYTKTPLEIANVVKKKTLYINSHLSAGNAENGAFPLMIYDMSNLSRYEFVIINEDKKASAANIPLTQMWKVQRLSDHYYDKHLDAEAMKADEDIPAAYTVQIGYFQNKTPAQVLLEATDVEAVKNKMREQYKYLQANLSRYPGNQRQMDAIAQAVRLYDAGELSGQKAKRTSTPVVIYEAAMRPLRSKSVPAHLKQKNPNFSFVYDIKIEWALGEKNAVQITITNYYAPVIVKEDGMLNVLAKEADEATKVKNTMILTADEWADILRLIDMDMRRFEMLHAKESYAKAMQIEKQNREEYRAQAGTGN